MLGSSSVPSTAAAKVVPAVERAPRHPLPRTPATGPVPSATKTCRISFSSATFIAIPHPSGVDTRDRQS
ncbi:hypothetical protein BGZ96_012606, partial [Linnemannia gamsii]